MRTTSCTVFTSVAPAEIARRADDCRCELIGDESFPSESASEGLVSPVSVRVELLRTSVSTFLNVEDTVSHDQQFTQFFPFLRPLLSPRGSSDLKRTLSNANETIDQNDVVCR